MVKLTRVLEVLRNFVNHIHDKHNSSSFEDWYCVVPDAIDVFKALMPPEEYTAHAKEIKAALENAERINDHDF